MFWQIYQKLMLSGFLSSGNLCLIHYFKLFWPHAASTASNRKGAKIQHEFSWFCQKSIFSKHQNKVILFLKSLNSRTWKTEVHSSDFPGLRNLSSLIDLSGLRNLTGLNSFSSPISPQKTSWSWWSDHHCTLLDWVKKKSKPDFLI
jgi:hypothetical protein